MNPDPLNERTEEVFAFIADTHAEIRAFCAIVSGRPSRDALVDALQALARILPDHFVYEERPGGLFDRLRTRDFVPDDAVDALVEDHRQFLSELEEMETDQSTDEPQLRAWARSFAHRLGEHEFRENALAAAQQGAIRR